MKLVPHFLVLHFRPGIFGPVFSSPAFSVLHFQVLHFPTLEIWSLIFHWYRSVFDLFDPSLVLHLTVLHFQSILCNKNITKRVPYRSALEVWSRQGAIQIHIYLYTFTLLADNKYCYQYQCTQLPWKNSSLKLFSMFFIRRDKDAWIKCRWLSRSNAQIGSRARDRDPNLASLRHSKPKMWVSVTFTIALCLYKFNTLQQLHTMCYSRSHVFVLYNHELSDSADFLQKFTMSSGKGVALRQQN